MATASLIPVELYLRSSYEPDAEYVDGEIELRPPGEYDHATLQQAIQLWFLEHGKEWNVRVRPELRVQVSPTRYRVPDVVVFDRSRPIEQILTHAPVAVFEVLSPEDVMSRVMRKLADYEAMGISAIVVIDPERDLIYQYRQGALEPISQHMMTIAEGPCFVDWNAVRELMD